MGVSWTLRSRGALGIVMCVVIAAVLLVAPRAQAYLYYNGYSNVISRTNPDGKDAQLDYISQSNLDPGYLAIDGSQIYFTSGANHIARANLDGSNLDVKFITLPGNLNPTGIAVGDGYIFFSYENTSTSVDGIGRANVNGSGVEPNLIPNLSDAPCGLALSTTSVYWSTSDSEDLGRANLDGTGVDTSFIPTNGGYCGIAVQGPYLYWSDGGTIEGAPATIGRADLDGSGVDQSLVTGLPFNEVLSGIAVSPTRIYWALSDEDRIGSSTIAGADVNNDFINQTDQGGGGGAVDSLAVDGLSSPTLAKTANAYPVKGTVLVKLRGSHSFVPLSSARSIPFGSTVDATSGTVSLQTVTKHGKIQTAEFYDGQFLLTQAHDGLVSLKLNAPLSCGKHGVLEAAGKRPKKKKRILWGDGHGGYRTVGGYGAGTVLGTKWETIDSCSETQFKVAEGEIKVADFRKHKTVVVKAPHSYVARP